MSFYAQTDKRIGVLMVIGSFFPEITGGGLQALSLMDALKKEAQFYIITHSNDINLPEEDIVNAVKVFRVISKGPRGFCKIRAFLRFIHLFLKIKDKVDIVHLHGFSQKSILFIVLAKLFGKKIIEKTSSLGVDDPVSIRNQKASYWSFFFYTKCDAFVSISPAISQRFEEYPFLKKRLFFIPNGVNLERFKPLKDEQQKLKLKKDLGLKPQIPTIIYVGFFSYDKAPDLAWNAYRMLRSNSRHNPQLLFLGFRGSSCFEVSPELIGEIKRDVKGTAIKEDVFFIEKTLTPERYYQASDIFILSSVREGLSNSLLEAMACGLSCIATRLKGVNDYLIRDGENGLLFESGNEVELSHKLENLLQDQSYASRLGTNAREAVKKLCSMDLVSRKYFKMYNWLLKKSDDESMSSVFISGSNC
jgi:glycosyltransferase involved in cell wall biosynthesis